jgi:ABC-2 type transport system permease protein
LRDYRTDRSYVAAFVLGVLGPLVSLAVFFYLARIVDAQDLDDPSIRAGGYFTFVVLGIAVFDVLNALLISIPSRVRQDQLTGALEALLATPAHPSAIALGYGLYDLLRAAVEAVLLLVVAALVFGLDLTMTWSGGVAAATALGLLLLLFAAVGVAAAGLVVAFKRVQAAIGLLASAVALLGTVYFPATILPSGLEALAEVNPVTWGLEVIRAALTGNSIPEGRIALLAAAAAVAVPTSVAVMRVAVRHTKRQGTLNVF